MQQVHVYNVIGLMSGTSLDGLDVCLTQFTKHLQGWKYQVLKAKTYPYSEQIKTLLGKLKDCAIEDYLKLNIEYSKYTAETVLTFLANTPINPILISSHGHTVLHQPCNLISLQCCDPTYLAAATGIDCVGNFRQLDVYRGGQGAPLVPYGAELFPQFECFLNFGGIINIDYKGVGWDIGYGNMISNHYAQLLGKEFDRNGQIGKQGVINQSVWNIFQFDEKLNNLTSNQSFAREDFQAFLNKLNLADKIKETEIKNCLFTHYKFLSELIIKHVKKFIRQKFKIQGKIRILCTGGGVYNKYLMDLLSQNNQQIEFIIPDSQTIEFKEAIIFGFLGIKFLRNQQNCAGGVGGILAKGTILKR